MPSNVDIDRGRSPLLEAAARLQDVGYLIDYDKHHKHSYHLILNSRLAGFRPQELELIANIARYHRGKEPKKKHENYDGFRPTSSGCADWRRSCDWRADWTAATQQVQALSVTVGKSEIEMRVLAPQCPEVDLWAARRRAEPFEKVFERKLLIEWQDLQQPLPAKQRSETQPANNAENGAATKRGSKLRAKRSN